MEITKERKVIWGLIFLLIVTAVAYRVFEPGVRNGVQDRHLNALMSTYAGETSPGVDVSGMPDKIPVEAAGVGVHPETGASVVLLVTEDGKAYLPVFIGPFEGDAISRALEGVRTPRPLIHDLFSEVIDVLGGKVEEVAVASLEEGTFRADLVLKTADGESVGIDARPSDSIAIAIKKGVDIFVAASVMEAAGYEIKEEDDVPAPAPDPDTFPQMPDAELI